MSRRTREGAKARRRNSGFRRYNPRRDGPLHVGACATVQHLAGLTQPPACTCTCETCGGAGEHKRRGRLTLCLDCGGSGVRGGRVTVDLEDSS